jgi:hypothetical protein
MRKDCTKTLVLAVVMAVLPFAAHGQTFQALPEIDAFYRLDPNWRLYFQAKETREGGALTTAEIGPSLGFHLKSLQRLREIAAYDLDESKSQALLFSVGYRILPTPGEPPTNRLEPYVIVHLPAPGRLLLSDRNRADLDWKSGNFSWHYRNRIDIERPWKIRGYHWSPYAAAEFWYTSQYSKWSTTSVFLGCLFPFGKHVGFNPYYEHENNTGEPPIKS